MKTFKKMMALAIAMVMVLSLSMAVFATDGGGTGDGNTPAAETYSITVANTNTAMSIVGKTYTAYKLFDVTYDGSNYAYSIKTDNPFYSTAAAKTVLDSYFDFTDTSDPSVKTVTVKEDKQDSETKTLTDSDVRALANALQPYATGTGAGSVTATAETAIINLTEAGYYIVTGTVKPTDPANSDKEVVSAIILDNATPTATVKPKASVPPLDKKITGVTDSGEVLDDKGKAAVAKVGSTVSYELESAVPDLTGYTKYTFTFGDKITPGLDYVSGSFKLKIGNSAETTVTPTIAADGKSFTYSIDFATFTTYLEAEGNNPGDKITLTYSCTVNDAALNTDYENNTADLEYSHSPYDNTTNKTPEKKTYVIDLNLDVEKIDGSNNNKKLDGAKFKLYRSSASVDSYTPAESYVPGTDYYYLDDGDGNGWRLAEVNSEEDFNKFTEGYLYTKDASSAAKEYYKWDTTNKKVTWTTEEDADVFVTNRQGKLTQQVRGLDKGTYYLEETEAPTGYNRLKDPVEVVISVVEDANGETVTYSATYGGENAAMTNGEVDLTKETQASGKQPVATGVIKNNSGTELPSTGGIGTTLFYIIGAILVLGAGILLVTRRRMNAQ